MCTVRLLLPEKLVARQQVRSNQKIRQLPHQSLLRQSQLASQSLLLSGRPYKWRILPNLSATLLCDQWTSKQSTCKHPFYACNMHGCNTCMQSDACNFLLCAHYFAQGRCTRMSFKVEWKVWSQIQMKKRLACFAYHITLYKSILEKKLKIFLRSL